MVLSAIIVFIPGLALALGFAELGKTFSIWYGSGDGLIHVLFKLYFGAFIGIGIGFAIFGQSDAT